MPGSVGIIANPASGKDIRRLVAHGSVFDNQEKVNIIRRVLIALDSLGVEQVFVMPDYADMGLRAAEDINLALRVDLLDFDTQGRQEDSTAAARLLAEMDVGCIITLGGDGTNRVVAKACRDIPLVPISTGTNNVFPCMVEGTIAGLAAGVVASGLVDAGKVCRRAPILEILREGDPIDIALVDAVITDDLYAGARAVWDVGRIKEIFLARSTPSAVGFSSVGGILCPLPRDSRLGVHIEIGPGENTIRSQIAPGKICRLPIAKYRTFEALEEVPIESRQGMIALDGEREIALTPKDRFAVRLNPQGPLVVDIEKALEAASEGRCFHEDESRCVAP